MSTLSKLQTYMGGRKALLPGALALSAMSSLMGMLPFVFIWLIVRELFKSQAESSQELINIYAWWAMGTAMGGVLVYFLALMLSHMAAFRAETNMRRQAMQKIVQLPLGFFDANTSGRIRKIIDDNASVTHMFLAHQMPDLAGSILTPLAALVLIFVFDWRLGLACLVPIIAAMMIMGFMMGKHGRYFMQTYMDSLEDMNRKRLSMCAAYHSVPLHIGYLQQHGRYKGFDNKGFFIYAYGNLVSNLCYHKNIISLLCQRNLTSLGGLL